MQIVEPGLKIGLILGPCQTVHAGSGITLEREECLPEQIDAEMVEERGELLLLPQPNGFSHAVERMGHACPALRPERILLARVPLGRRPSLHRLRHQLPGFVRRFRRYYNGVRLLAVVHHRLWLLTFPMRTKPV